MTETHLPDLAVAPDAQVERLGEGIDDGNTHAVQAAGNLIGVLVELAARVQLGHDDFGGGDAFFLVNIDRHAAAVVAYGNGTIGVQRDVNAIAVTGERLVDGVVDDFVDHLVQARTVIGIADVHAGTFADGI